MSVVFAQITPTIFREYDIRGLVGREITFETAGAIARAYAAYLRERGERRVVVGR
ncbi:MAG: phosphomannomutase, partial [Armatimonadetes bacterium]|nr:phosphomannomutase [Armatimonadota bacterium]